MFAGFRAFKNKLKTGGKLHPDRPVVVPAYSLKFPQIKMLGKYRSVVMETSAYGLISTGIGLRLGLYALLVAAGISCWILNALREDD